MTTHAKFNINDRVIVTKGPAAGAQGHVTQVHLFGGFVDQFDTRVGQKYRYSVKLVDGRAIPSIPEDALGVAPTAAAPTEQELDKIIKRIQKMHDKAVSAQALGNEAEAMAFMAGVKKTLDKYKLTMSDVEYKERDQVDPIAWQRVVAEDHGLQTRNTRVAWIIKLAEAVAVAHHCRVLVYPRSSDVAFVGRSVERKLAESVFVTVQRFAHNEADKQYSAFYRKCQREGDTFRARGYRNDWLRGFVLRVHDRYLKEKAEFEAQMRSQGVSLVRLSTALQQVDEHMSVQKKNKQIGSARGVRGKRIRNSDGFRDGQRTADKANLRGIGLDAGKGSGPAVGAGSKQLPGSK